MRFSKLIFIGVLLIAAGSILLYFDQSQGKTRACERRIRKAQTAVCKWTHLGETRIWRLDFKEGESLFKELQDVMLDDLKVPREEVTNASIPEYQISLKDLGEAHLFDFNVFTGRTTWVECNGGTYQSKGYTQKFLSIHAKNFVMIPEKAEK